MHKKEAGEERKHELSNYFVSIVTVELAGYLLKTCCLHVLLAGTSFIIVTIAVFALAKFAIGWSNLSVLGFCLTAFL